MRSATVKKALGLQDSPHLHGKNVPAYESDPTVLEWLHDVFPSMGQVGEYFVGLLPFMRWIRHYNFQWFLGDLVAGITVGAVVVPQGMGYAKLANLPVQYGLYTSFMGVLIYWFFATSKDITIGPVAVMSTVVGSIITDVQKKHPDIPGPQVALSIAIMCGSIVTFMGLARLGFIVDFIPLPAIAAFMAGSAITICSGQVKQLLGETASFDTSTSAYQIIINTLKSLPTSQGYDAAMGVTALAALYILRSGFNYGARKNPRFAKLFFFLGALRTVCVILVFTLISFAVNHHRRKDPAFALVGTVPLGFGHTGVPVLTGDVIKLFASKLPACVIVLLIEHIAVSKSFGRVNNYTINPSQELIAIGITNLLGPFVGAFPATGSFSRSAIQSKSGARTPFTGIITACIVLIAMYTLTAGLYYIPKATLSAVIIHAVGDLIVPPNTIYQFWLISPLDAIIFAVGLIVALASTIPNSIYATVCLSVVVLLFRHAKAPGHFLGQAWISDRNSERPLFLPLDETEANPSIKVDRPRPGVFVYRFSEGLNYPNAGHYLDNLVQTIFKHTRRTNAEAYAKKGDRPWNDADSSDKDVSHLPVLRAIILDFSAVNNVDVTCVQNLIDVRTQLDRRSAPVPVQWHFANVKNRWTKRALTAAGFGSAPLQQVASANDDKARSDVEKGSVDMSVSSEVCDKPTEDGPRPFFHPDLTSALQKVDEYLALYPAE
ncbi:sulfate anion transporter [Penicillium bovifimosum]|uniref:Sulfate anion transporter n=1 Tax=Penicillium bovifimosum TaxID=126998 RepID=A0A9W9GNM5_9EURO|nr:sulfate anion transporter [Penicillium bovifimosum]KAJ5124971.1 sulfate anion transporter [Penicillium bovifimosum]